MAINWPNAGTDERHRLKIAATALHYHLHLLDAVFDSSKPQLLYEPDELLNSIRVLSSGERILAKVAMDIWGGYGNVRLFELEGLDGKNIEAIFEALSELWEVRRKR